MKKPKLVDASTLPDPVPLTKEQIKEMMSRFPECLREAERKRNEPPRDDRTGACVFCKGKVVARVTREYLGDPRHMIIGPGSKNQMSVIHHGFHCTKCGLKYEFPPNVEQEVDDEGE